MINEEEEDDHDANMRSLARFRSENAQSKHELL